MNPEERTALLIHLGEMCTALSLPEWSGYEAGITEEEFKSFRQLVHREYQHNGWFTKANVDKALSAWGKALEESHVRKWLNGYSLNDASEVKTVGIVGAGNIPLVAMHDVISAFAAGHQSVVKLSRDDNRLIPALWRLLAQADERVAAMVRFAEGKLENFDAVIATGSNNTSRYFEQYFGQWPHIIRKNRRSVAVLTGAESSEELEALGRDIFDYFGMGCRNVSALLVPEGYNFDTFFNAIYPFRQVIEHNKYANNYDYNKAVWLLNSESLLDNGFLLLKQHDTLHAPLASLYWQAYTDESTLERKLKQFESEVQCITGRGHIPFGQAQCPMLWHYADGVDTMRFLSSI